MRNVQTALVHLLTHQITHVTFRLAFAVIENDLLLTFGLIFEWVAQTLSTSPTARRSWIFLLRNSAGLLIDLHLVQIDRQLAIALIINQMVPIIIIQ